tara:strand:+ start:4472 stop:6001 length:1530 start_codon:yes stop_codon:yes gene_type:complete
MRLRIFAVFLLVLSSAPSFAAIEPIVIDVYSYNSDDYLRVKIVPEFAADMLMGEPLIACRAKWSIQSARIDGEGYPLSYFPKDALKKTRLFSLQLIFQIGQGGRTAISCDPGYLDAPGSNEWSFTVTGSPAWQKLIRNDIKNTFTNSLQSQFNLRDVRSPSYLDADSAKKTYHQAVIQASALDRSWLRWAAVEKGEVNLWPLKRFILERRLADREKIAEKRSAAAKVVAVNDIDSLFSDAAFDAQLKQVNKSIDDRSALRGIRRDIENGDEQSKNKNGRLVRQSLLATRNSEACIEKMPAKLKTLLVRTQECHAKWQGLERFEQHGRYGYKLDGDVVIEAQYSEATRFKDGYALVEKNDRLLSITPTGEEHDRLYGIKLESSYFSPQGLVLASEDDLFGFINSKGETVIEFQYSAAEPFDDLDRAIVKKYRGAQLIDENGTVLARSPISFSFKDGHYISRESYDHEDGNCDDGDLISGSTQVYTADGEKVGGLEHFSYRRKKLCLLRSR